MKKSIVVVGLICLVSAACEPTDSYVEQPKADMGAEDMPQVQDQGSDGGADSGADLGGDAEPDAPDEPCGGACAGATPICNPANDMCVACLADTDCTGSATVCDTSNNSCVACLSNSDCTGGDPACNTSTKTCVACVDNSTCNDAGASKCSGDTCGACQVKDDCSHISGKTACDAGVCKQCSKDDDSACGANSCDLATNTCTNTPKGSVNICGACKADSECVEGGVRCVPMNFMGTARGGYCLIDDAVGDCIQPYSTSLERTSLGGVASFYCGVNESFTTCEAVLDLRANKACTGANDHATCGSVGLDDARCANISPVGNPNFRCSYRCGGDEQCKSGTTCQQEQGGPLGQDVCR